MSILDNAFGLWWVAMTSTIAAGSLAFWSMQGSGSQRAARLMLTVAMLFMATSYWWDLISGVSAGPQEMRRGAGMVWFPAVVWAVWAEASRHRQAVVKAHEVLDQYAAAPARGADDE